jgi:hypothetical protein
MNDAHRRSYERGSRVDAFMAANAADFPAGSKGADVAARLKTELARIAELDVAKATSASTRQKNSTGRRDLRDSLRTQLAAVSDTAEVIARDHAEFKGLFPRTRPDQSDQTLIAVARSFSSAAAPLKARFVEYEMPPDFVERLKSDADAFEGQINRQTEGAGASVNTNASIGDALGRVDDSVERLEVIVRNKYRADPARLAAWESASRLERAPRAKRSDDATTTPQTATQK